MSAKETIEEWFITYGKEIYNYLIYCVWSEDVDDLLQEVFLRAYRGYGSFKGDSHPKTWLYTIARRVIVDAKRKNKSSFTKLNLLKSALHDTPKTHRSPEQIYEYSKRYQLLMKHVNTLNKNQRDVVILRGIKEFSVKESAEILRWTEAKVSDTFHRALKHLKVKIEAEGREDFE
ncbi:RNA polymerase sigma-70 factor (ECF subfamily) [Pullulanibacillus pueri]|uniref:RNA polymerase sigma factor n=1 Tax=Pullulanibacillus pueri TaxID=1437324 RepID=A0A8J2ZXY1_9BACL|nr:RNA polymerase sigma factor [Pullulanibacillus pueri]MBM7683859.1 RNA polymerase sigma-70 factor (ECF subfamily) [Pullulanibacillus pueri]GGH84584.1 RNA polymerase sigma factor YlaC [Pullulanibacillus pueri]